MICVSLQGTYDHVRKVIGSLDASKEMVEIRCDLLESVDHLKELFTLIKEKKVEAIATCRDLKPPGFTPARKQVLLDCMSFGASHVDLEVEAPQPYKDEIVAFAKKRGVKIIVSMHNYEKSEESSLNLDSIISQCFDCKADIAKVAVSVVSTQGASRVLALYNDPRPIVAIGMGPFGKITRLSALLLGAPFSFACYDEASATAPGQMSKHVMHHLLGYFAAAPDEGSC